MGKRNTFCLNSLVSIMRISLIQFSLAVTFSSIVLAHDINGQEVLDQRITLNARDQSVKSVLQEIETIVDVHFIYSSSRISPSKKVTVIAQKEPLGVVLEKILSPLQLTYQISGRQIVIKRAKSATTTGSNSNAPNPKSEFSQVEPKPENLLPPTIAVTGVIADDQGAPLVGATVQVKGTDIGTVTDVEGKFSLQVPDLNAVLVVSYTGFEMQEIALAGRNSIQVILTINTKSLEELVVVGYGVQKKINTTGAISTISTKELVQSPVANISNSLVGRLPGLFATQSGGEPGNDASKIRIRGIGTFSGNTDPLVLVDGIEVSNYNNIDPNEIESVTILKDASSTAVYGIRGANGVLIITTKRGKTGAPKVSYTANQGFNSFTGVRETMNAADYAANFNQALKADAYATGAVYVPRYTPTDIELYANGQDPIFHPNSNWFDLLYKKVSTQSQHNLSISGGQKRVRYFISGGYYNQQGLFKDTKDIIDAFSPQSIFSRYNIRSNFNFDITSRLKMALDLSSQTEIRSGNNGSSTERVIGDIARASSLETPGVVDGKIVNIYTGSRNNPYASLLYPNAAGGLKRSYRNYLNGSLRFDYDLGMITKGLSLNGFAAIQTYNDQQIVNSKTVITYLAVKLPDGTINYVPSTTEAQFNFSQSGTYNRRLTAQAGIDYKRTFGKHGVTALLLYNQQKTTDPSLAFLIPKGYQSFVGRATYDFGLRYLAEVNVGYNGTENFAPGKRFGLFPAYSLGWVLSEESFFPKQKLISFFKVRGSYGEVGNDNIGGSRFLYNPTSYSTVGSIYYFGNVGSTYTAFTGLREGATGNPDVTWERAIKQNLGVEIRMFKDKLKFTGDVFTEKRSDILATPQTISNVTGLSQPAKNLGRMENKGYEGDLTFTDNLGEFGYRISANYSFARNKVLYRDEIPNQYAYQNRTGQRLGQFYGLISDGIYNTWEEVNDSKRPLYQYANNKIQPGDLIFRDVNGDGIVNDFDQVPIGYSNTPEITYGLSLGANFKGFDLSVLFQGVDNVSLYYSKSQRNSGYGGAPPEGSASYLVESWTPERYAAGLPIKFPRFTVSTSPNSATSTFYLADASYLRIKNVEVGYTAKASVLKKIGISSCRIYANANNLFTWDKVYPGIDPENTSTGDTNTEPYPLVRTINFGLNINF